MFNSFGFPNCVKVAQYQKCQHAKVGKYQSATDVNSQVPFSKCQNWKVQKLPSANVAQRQNSQRSKVSKIKSCKNPIV
jgi:hypothetical protein